MSDVLNKMKSRRSIRKFKPDMVPQEILDQIIEAGLYAASGMGQQSPIIIQVTKKELRDEISKMNCEIGGWKEGLGVNGDYEGIGHCALGYADGDYPAAPARNEGRIFYVK